MTTTTGAATEGGAAPEVIPHRLGQDTVHGRDRLLALRAQLLEEQQRSASPAVARALEMADAYLFLALGYTGYTEELFPGERPLDRPR